MSKHRKPIFVSSDWHVGHSNVIQFDNRPFRDLDHMHRVLINNFNANVPENGVTYFLGDMGLCKAETIKSVVEQLNGTKILILGNHDKGANAMYQMGFDAVLYNAALVVANQLVTMSHCPLPGIPREDITNMKGAKPGECWHGEFKHKKFTVPNQGQFHLSGHIHSRPGRDVSHTIQGRQMDVGVSAHQFRPVSISEIESWIALTLKEEKHANRN